MSTMRKCVKWSRRLLPRPLQGIFVPWTPFWIALSYVIFHAVLEILGWPKYKSLSQGMYFLSKNSHKFLTFYLNIYSTDKRRNVNFQTYAYLRINIYYFSVSFVLEEESRSILCNDLVIWCRIRCRSLCFPVEKTENVTE